MKKIYLDYAATTPVKKEVFKVMKPYFCQKYGNASSIHSFGQEARVAVEKTRNQIAKFLHCDRNEIIFTSGGTESDNLAIRGLIIALRTKSQETRNKPHIVTSTFEHHAVLDTCKDLERRGLAEITYIKPDEEGIIHPVNIRKAIKPNTVLVSVMYVNNEIGTIQPIKEIAKIILEKNKKQEFLKQARNKIYFHTDAVQAIEYCLMNVKKIGVDMLSISAHKFGGSKGVGILYLKRGTPIHRENIGGAQEFNLRAGTENVAGIVGLGKALQLLPPQITNLKSKNYDFVLDRSSQPISTLSKSGTSQNHNSLIDYDLPVLRKVKERYIFIRGAHIAKLRDYFINRILKEIPDTSLNGSKKFRSPNNINISFKYIEGESILIHLDKFGIAASSGSACTSGSLDPSHVLLSIGLSHEDAHGSIRFTIGEKTTKGEIDYTVNKLKEIVKKLRQISPFGK